MLNRCIKVLKFNNTVKQQPKERGFTIIEVVLVLAIAGLIFLMVFIALPALQRNQRDTQRKNDMSRVLSAVQSYQSNNKGKVVGDGNFFRGEFLTSYLLVNGENFKDPDGSDYTFTVDPSRDTTIVRKVAATGQTIIYVWHNGTCDGENLSTVAGYSKIAILMKLEGGGVYCVNN